MPRATQSKGGQILSFFKTASLEVAEYCYAQVQDVMRERRGRQQKAKARAQIPPAAPPERTVLPTKASEKAKRAAAKASTKKKAAPKKKTNATPRSHHRAAAPVSPPLPDPGPDPSVIPPADEVLEDRDFNELDPALLEQD